MKKLSEYARGRDNNFNLIRFVAAMMVLYSHSFALALGGGEPWSQFGVTPGSIAVDIFFVTSGFLVTASLVVRKELCSFVVARVLRIYPALLVMVFLTVFVLGVTFTTAPLHDYFNDIEIVKYVLRNTTLFAGCCGHLPHVFDDNPVKQAVNGSLWTMPWEVRMYFLLFGIGVVAKFLQWREQAWKPMVVIAFVIFSVAYFVNHYVPAVSFMQDNRALRLCMLFFMGATFYAYKEKISISHLTGFSALILVAAALLAGEWLFLPLYTVLVGYAALYLAYLPAGGIRKFNQLGDYSYGVYIYAFPIQQAIVSMNIGITGMHLFLIALPCTLLCAVLSWHLIEKRSLKIKSSQLFCNAAMVTGK